MQQRRPSWPSNIHSQILHTLFLYVPHLKAYLLACCGNECLTLCRLQTSPEFKQWESGKRRRGIQKVLSWQSLLSVTVLLLLGCTGFFLVRNATTGLSLGGGHLPADVTKLLDSKITQKDTTSVKTPAQEPTTMQMTEQAALADQRGKQVALASHSFTCHSATHFAWRQ